MAERLASTDRIRRRAEFENIYAHGSRRQSRSFTVYLLPTDRAFARLGVAATRKLGGAVVRNRAKRLARELFRRRKPTTGLDIVIVPRREMLDAPFTTLEAEYQAILARRIERHPRGPAGPRRGRGPHAAESV